MPEPRNYHLTFKRDGRPRLGNVHVRWTSMDGLNHWVSTYSHKRLCDDRSVAGFNHATQVQVPTCFACILRR